MKTKVVHCMRSKYDIYIGRPGKWGNPFTHQDGTRAEIKVASRQEAVSKYREYILNNKALIKDLHELKDKVLGCWCSPRECHGDVLAELSEAQSNKTRYNGGVECDVEEGPCACKAWH